MTALSVLVVNYGHRDLLDGCLRSLADGLAEWAGTAETMVVDNGSADDSCAMVRDQHPGVRLLALPANRGFGGAVNAGVAATDGEWVLVLNNDLTLAPGTRWPG